MTEKILGEIRTLDDYHHVARARARDLGLTMLALDKITGLQEGYCAKLLAPVPIKTVGRVSLGPLNGALCIKLIAVEDADAVARFGKQIAENRRTRPQRLPQLSPEIEKLVEERLAERRRRQGRRAARKYMRSLTPEQRTCRARHAARMRWKNQAPELTGQKRRQR